MKEKKRKQTGRASLSYGVIIFFLIFFAILCIMPFWYVMVSSFSDPQLVKEGQFRILPTGYSLQAYEMLFRDKRFFSGIGVTVFRTVIGTSLSIVTQTAMAYALSKSFMIGKSFFTKMVVFTLLFNGGIIPTYLVIQKLQLLDHLEIGRASCRERV